MIKNIATYIRCSTEKQEITIQKDLIKNYINYLKKQNKKNNYIITNYTDEGFSGSKLDRPSFTRMINDVENNKIDIVIVTKLDRLSRSLQDLLNTVKKFENYSCDFIVIQDNINTSNAQGRLFFHIIGAFAEFEREVIKERMSAGRKKAEVSGTKSGKPCHRPKLNIDVDGVVKKFEDKMSMKQIAKNYNVSITPIRRILKERGLINNGAA